MMVGVLGGGQLGRMLALAGYPLGLRFRFLDTSAYAPAGHLAELLVGDYEELSLHGRFISGLEVISYEFENVPVAAVEALAQRVPVYPPPRALSTAQDRLMEKTFFQEQGIPTPPFHAVNSESDLRKALEQIGLPAILKTRRLGYDGKGQLVLRERHETEYAWRVLGDVPQILEAFVPFDRELSVLAVRGRTGDMAYYPLVENHHRDGMLRLSLAPAPRLTADLQQQAERYATKVLKALDYVGVLAIEFFEVNGQLIANEMAPRVHNSGHWTIEGAATSQFENHLRAVLGWPLGSTRVEGCCAMVNLIGQTPSLEGVLSFPEVCLHLYGKSPAPGRKLGHITLLASDEETMRNRLARLGHLEGM